MTSGPTLPHEFAVLEPFTERWAINGSANRAALRTSSTAEEREAFFAAADPLLDRALEYLDARALCELSQDEMRLMELMLSLAHVALAVEIQGPDEPKSAQWRDRMRITRSPAEREPA
ncbi:hypothetical protein GCM10011494_34890 [Novosphingobium endophyticum]|uniref:Uncharacterized protein n=1 Tax=Novosphingobium endophyticum TaxID=1955250 RepID=A0A916X7D0_9SPHN|nr:hypothetical protein [Novosphingobium endophyticum]GGC13046.1 hypothetical protein GCM10011494_34890 [Novosphingobium endophyticum]